MVSPGLYEKVGRVWAEVAAEPGTILTKEGSTAYLAGEIIVDVQAANPNSWNKVISLEERAKDEQKPFGELLREGARKLLQATIENEVIDYLQFHKDRLDENGQRLVVRHGHLPEREVISGAGPIPVRQPRVRHRDQGRFTSAILPKYMRRAPSVDAFLSRGEKDPGKSA